MLFRTLLLWILDILAITRWEILSKLVYTKLTSLVSTYGLVSFVEVFPESRKHSFFLVRLSKKDVTSLKQLKF